MHVVITVEQGSLWILDSACGKDWEVSEVSAV